MNLCPLTLDSMVPASAAVETGLRAFHVRIGGGAPEPPGVG